MNLEQYELSINGLKYLKVFIQLRKLKQIEIDKCLNIICELLNLNYRLASVAELRELNISESIFAVSWKIVEQTITKRNNVRIIKSKYPLDVIIFYSLFSFEINTESDKELYNILNKTKTILDIYLEYAMSKHTLEFTIKKFYKGQKSFAEIENEVLLYSKQLKQISNFNIDYFNRFNPDAI
jgi:hypothetical protein